MCVEVRPLTELGQSVGTEIAEVGEVLPDPPMDRSSDHSHVKLLFDFLAR